MIDISAISTVNLGFSTAPSATKLTPAIATTTDNWKLQYGRFARQSLNFWQSVVIVAGTLKTRDWKTRDQMTRVENAGLENAGPTKYGKPNVT